MGQRGGATVTLSEGRIALGRGEPNFLSTAVVVTLSGERGDPGDR